MLVPGQLVMLVMWWQRSSYQPWSDSHWSQIVCTPSGINFVREGKAPRILAHGEAAENFERQTSAEQSLTGDGLFVLVQRPVMIMARPAMHPVVRLLPVINAIVALRLGRGRMLACGDADHRILVRRIYRRFVVMVVRHHSRVSVHGHGFDLRCNPYCIGPQRKQRQAPSAPALGDLAGMKSPAHWPGFLLGVGCLFERGGDPLLPKVVLGVLKRPFSVFELIHFGQAFKHRQMWPSPPI